MSQQLPYSTEGVQTRVMVEELKRVDFEMSKDIDFLRNRIREYFNAT